MSETNGAALLISVEEAAQLLSIGRNTAYELIRQGRLPHIRLGRRVLVPRFGLEQWIAQEAGLSTSPESVVKLQHQAQQSEGDA